MISLIRSYLCHFNLILDIPDDDAHYVFLTEPQLVLDLGFLHHPMLESRGKLGAEHEISASLSTCSFETTDFE